jgi:DnaK suppressor protein
MLKEFLKEMKDNLLAQKQSILDLSNVPVDIVDNDGDETDEIQANILMGINNQLNIRNNAKLSQINDALIRMELDNYGICEDCGEEINYKRLLVNPYFLTCISCAEAIEMQARQKRKA